MVGALVFSVIKKSRDAARKREVVPERESEESSILRLSKDQLFNTIAS
jgi:hypothetical protein